MSALDPDRMDRTAAILAVRHRYSSLIADGTKLWEFRRTPPPKYDRLGQPVTDVIVYQIGTPRRADDGIIGWFTIGRRVRQLVTWWVDQPPQVRATYGFTNPRELAQYAAAGSRRVDGMEEVTGLEVAVWHGLAETTSATVLHPSFTRAPQSFRYPPEGWRTTLTAAGGPLTSAERIPSVPARCPVCGTPAGHHMNACPRAGQ